MLKLLSVSLSGNVVRLCARLRNLNRCTIFLPLLFNWSYQIVKWKMQQVHQPEILCVCACVTDSSIEA